MTPSRAGLSPVPPGLLPALSRPLDEPRPGLAPERRRVPCRDPALREIDVAGRRLPGPPARHVAGRSGLDLTVVIHSFTMTVPYPPGAWDTWDNVFLQRAAGHVWNAQRNMAALIGAKTEEERKRGIKARLDDVLATAGATSLARRRADQAGGARPRGRRHRALADPPDAADAHDAPQVARGANSGRANRRRRPPRVSPQRPSDVRDAASGRSVRGPQTVQRWWPQRELTAWLAPSRSTSRVIEADLDAEIARLSGGHVRPRRSASPPAGLLLHHTGLRGRPPFPLGTTPALLAPVLSRAQR